MTKHDENDDLARSEVTEIRDRQPAAVTDAGHHRDSAERFKQMFTPVTYTEVEGDSLARRMLIKIHNTIVPFLLKPGAATFPDPVVRTIHSAAVAGIEGPDPDYFVPPAAAPDAGAPQEPPHEFTLRKAFWVNHGCPFSALYGDDGEMQCNAIDCRLDFKREPFARLVMLLIARGRLHAGIYPKPDERAPAAHQERTEPTLEVIVNGQPVVVTAGTVRDVIEQAIQRSGQIGAPVAQWELRTTEGDIIPHDLSDGTDYELTPGRRLWLNLGLPILQGAPARAAEWQLQHRGDLTRIVKNIRAAETMSDAVDIAALFLQSKDPRE